MKNDTKYIIRKLTPSHFEECMEVQKNDGVLHQYLLTYERLQKLYANGEEFYGAFNMEEKIIGFASINNDLVRLRIHFFSISGAFQSKGVGTLLLNHVFDIARVSNIKTIYVYTEISSPLESFLLNKGFVNAGYFRRRFKDKDANILAYYL